MPRVSAFVPASTYYRTKPFNTQLGVNVDPVIWSVLEAYSAMICTSLITIRPLIVKYMPKYFKNTHSKNKSVFLSSDRKPRAGFHRNPKPWNDSDDIELPSPSQDRFLEHRPGSSRNDGKDRIETRVEISMLSEEDTSHVSLER